MHDGASFPWWLRWITFVVAVAILAFDGGTMRAFLYPAVLQWLVGWPLLVGEFFEPLDPRHEIRDRVFQRAHAAVDLHVR